MSELEDEKGNLWNESLAVALKVHRGVVKVIHQVSEGLVSARVCLVTGYRSGTSKEESEVLGDICSPDLKSSLFTLIEIKPH